MCFATTRTCWLWLLLPRAVALAELSFEPVILDPGYIAYERDVGDMDGDGDNDVVSIAYDDFTKLHLWRNNERGGPPAAPRPASAQ